MNFIYKIAAVSAVLMLPACGGSGVAPTLPATIAPITPLRSPPVAAPNPPIATDADFATAPRRVDVQPLNSTESFISWSDVSSDETEEGEPISARSRANKAR